MSTVFVCDAAEFVYSSDEGANEAKVNEGDKEAVFARAVPGEQCTDCPSSAEDGDDEEDEDVVGC